MPGHQLIGPMPGLTLDAGCMITAEAIDPATGATVSGVTISALTVYGVNSVPPEQGQTTPPAEVLPLFVPIPNDDAEAAA